MYDRWGLKAKRRKKGEWRSRKRPELSVGCRQGMEERMLGEQTPTDAV